MIKGLDDAVLLPHNSGELDTLAEDAAHHLDSREAWLQGYFLGVEEAAKAVRDHIRWVNDQA